MKYVIRCPRNDKELLPLLPENVEILEHFCQYDDEDETELFARYDYVGMLLPSYSDLLKIFKETHKRHCPSIIWLVDEELSSEETLVFGYDYY